MMPFLIYYENTWNNLDGSNEDKIFKNTHKTL
jgi:hypothetical protein